MNQIRRIEFLLVTLILFVFGVAQLSAQTFTSTAAATPSSISDTSSTVVLISVTDTGAALSGGNVILQIKNSSGTVVAGQTWTGVSMAAGAKATWAYTFSPSTLSPPLTTAGTYQLDVEVSSSGGTVYYSGDDGTVTITPSAPAAPTGLTATAGNASVALSWTASSGATSYNVYRGTTSGGESSTAIATGITATTYTDSTAVNGTKYYYEVAAVNSAGTSAKSNEASATPSAPAFTFTSTASASPSSITDNVSSTVTITVTNTGSALSDGNVELSIQNSSGTVEATNNWTGVNLAAGAKATYTYTYSPSTLSPGTYELEVGVFNTSWSTDYYWGVDGTITITLPAAPTGLTATAGNASVALNWTASSGATSYNVYRGTTSGGESSTALVTGITTTNYTDSTAVNGTKYYYEVAAVNSAGTSAKSNEASATPVATYTFTSTASASPSSITDNVSSTVTITVTNTGSALSDGNVELSIQSSSGTVEATNNWTGVNLAAGAKATYTYTFSPSTLSPALTTPGTYQLEVGVFNTSWGTDYYWGDDGTVTIASSVPALSVSGNKLVDANGNTVILQGVDKMGTEYECESGGVFDNTGLNISNTTVPGAAFIQALASWKVNVVRIPLNEDCWLGINGVPVGGSAYQQPIIDFVNELNQNGMYAIVDLHWNAGGTTVPTGQAGMADEDHSPAFWTSVATTFKGNNAVLFDLFNEPYVSTWSCWLSGGCSTNGFTVAGMQQLLDSVRATGATNVVMLGGLSYSNYFTLSPGSWLASEPTDTLNPPQIAASWHTYNGNDSNCSVSDVSCLQANWSDRLGNVPAAVPVITGEFGEFDCTDTYDDILLPWMTQQGLSYLAWAFNVQATDPTTCTIVDGLGPTNLISDSTGTPLAGGVGINAYYLQSGIGPD